MRERNYKTEETGISDENGFGQSPNARRLSIGKLQLNSNVTGLKETQTLNPIFIEILDESAESEVANNPIVEVAD